MIKINKILCCVIALLNGYATYSQIPRDTILYYKQQGNELSYFIINDNSCYEFKWDKKPKKYTILKDSSQLLLTLPRDFYTKSFSLDKSSNKLFMGGNENYWMLDLSNDSLKLNTSIETAENYIKSIIVDDKLYYTDYLSLYIVDIIKNEIIDSINIAKEFQDHLINEIVKFPNTDNVWLMLADLDGGDISNEQYYAYDEKNKTLKKHNNNNFIKESIPPEIFGVRFYDLLGDYVFLTERILNSNFEIYSNCLYQRYTDMYGLIIVKNEIKQSIRYSCLDSEDGKNDGNAVLIPFIPDPFKEKAIYEIYENIELKAEELKQFDAFDLRLLRNMIFAKHNSVFKDKFLQAYFNLYGFYSYNKNRLTNVSHLLTPMDKKNLELIRQAENKIKSRK